MTRVRHDTFGLGEIRDHLHPTREGRARVKVAWDVGTWNIVLKEELEFVPDLDRKSLLRRLQTLEQGAESLLRQIKTVRELIESR